MGFGIGLHLCQRSTTQRCFQCTSIRWDSRPILDGALFEFDMTENALRTELALEPLRAVDGEVEVPQGPGLGVEIDRDLLERYSS